MPEPEIKTLREYKESSEYWQDKWEKTDRDLVATKLAFDQVSEDNRKLRDKIKDLRECISEMQVIGGIEPKTQFKTETFKGYDGGLNGQ